MTSSNKFRLITLAAFTSIPSQTSFSIFLGFLAFPSKALSTPCWISKSFKLFGEDSTVSTIKLLNFFTFIFYNQRDFIGVQQKKQRISHGVAERNINELGFGRHLHTKRLEFGIKFPNPHCKLVSALSGAGTCNRLAAAFWSRPVDPSHTKWDFWASSATSKRVGKCQFHSQRIHR